MLIYRIEHKITGFGPYQSDDVGTIISRKHSADSLNITSKWPSGIIDFYKFSQNYYFGFDSLQSLFNWFDKEDIKLLKEYYITIYNCENFIVGKSKKQLIFELDNAKIVKFIDLSKWN